MKFKVILSIFWLVATAQAQIPSEFAAEKITLLGDNSKPHFSSDGTRIVYQSKNRPSHPNEQIYEWSFLNSRERRITYSDGNAEFPLFVDADARIAYLSTTDTLKSSLSLFSHQMPDSLSNNLFVAEQSGFPISKIGEEDSVMTDPSGVDPQTVLLVSVKNKMSELVALKILGKSIQTLFKKDKKDPATLHFPVLNAKKTLLWIEETANLAPTLYRQQAHHKEEKITIPFHSIHDMSWWNADEESLLISGKQDKDLFDSLYVFNIPHLCLIPLVNFKIDLWDAQTNFNRSKIAVSVLEKTQRQIEIINSPATLPECQK